MSVYMAAFGYELLAALEELVEAFEATGSDDACAAILATRELDEYRALIARAKGEGA